MRTKLGLSLLILAWVIVVPMMPLNQVADGDREFARKASRVFGAFLRPADPVGQGCFTAPRVELTPDVVGWSGRISKRKFFRCRKCGTVTDPWENPVNKN